MSLVRFCEVDHLRGDLRSIQKFLLGYFLFSVISLSLYMGFFGRTPRILSRCCLLDYGFQFLLGMCDFSKEILFSLRRKDIGHRFFWDWSYFSWDLWKSLASISLSTIFRLLRAILSMNPLPFGRSGDVLCLVLRLRALWLRFFCFFFLHSHLYKISIIFHLFHFCRDIILRVFSWSFLYTGSFIRASLGQKIGWISGFLVCRQVLFVCFGHFVLVGT